MYIGASLLSFPSFCLSFSLFRASFRILPHRALLSSRNRERALQLGTYANTAYSLGNVLAYRRRRAAASGTERKTTRLSYDLINAERLARFIHTRSLSSCDYPAQQLTLCPAPSPISSGDGSWCSRLTMSAFFHFEGEPRASPTGISK